MKTTILTIIFLATFCIGYLVQAQNPYYPNNREPLLKTQYVKLPLGAVKPKGWLYDQMVVQANGMTGHLPEVWDVVHTSSWKGDVGQNVLPECCYPRFVPRWLEGLVPLAYQLEDKRLKELANQYMGYLMTVQNLSKVTPSVVGWSHLGRVLQGYYEATGDERAIKLCQKILHYADSVKDVKDLTVVTPNRLGMILGFGWWYYNQSGEKDALEIVDRCTKKDVDDWKDYFTNFQDRDVTAQSGYPVKSNDRGRHGVDVAQAIQYPVAYYLKAKNESYRNSVSLGMKNLDKYNGQVNGRWNADEFLSGLKPTQGTELCDVTELIYSLVKDFEALGEVAFADRVEKLIFNALPGTCTADMWAHQYDQQANQVLVSDAERPWRGNTHTSNIFGFTPHYPCCLSNMHSPFPRYVENMWMATNDNGLLAAMYGPCEIKAKVGNNIDVTISEETEYPFSDVIVFKVNVSKPSDFPVYFRIPTWAEGAELMVAGKALNPSRGSVCKVEGNWKSGDVVTLRFNNKVRTETRYNNATSVTWGPLDFVLRIGESFKKIEISMDKPVKPSVPTGVANWQIEPTTAWNYALVIDRANPEYTVKHNKISKVPFAQKGEPIFLSGATDFITWQLDVPMVLKMKARKVVNWSMNGANAADVPTTLITSLTNNDTIVELIPYGCTRLRISEFPVISPKKIVLIK